MLRVRLNPRPTVKHYADWLLESASCAGDGLGWLVPLEHVPSMNPLTELLLHHLLRLNPRKLCNSR